MEMDKRPLMLTGFLLALMVVIGVMLPRGVTAEPPPPSVEEIKARWWTDDLSLILLPPLSPSLGPAPAGETPSSLSAITDLADWTRIAFQSYRDGNWEIYLARGDGSQQVRLTDHPAADTRPRLNRGATRLAFDSDRDGNFEIYTLNVDGSGLQRLTFNGANDAGPVWSPDGNRIAFASERDGNWEIYVMNADGSAQTRLTYGGADDFMPSWSPDGSQIAWVRRDGYDGVIWVMNADGSNPHPLTGELRFLQHPVWSPDGTRLAFDYDPDVDNWNELGMINADGTGLRVAYDAHRYLTDVWMGSWSPDGEWLLFSHVEYVVQDNQLYFRSTYIERVPATRGSAERLVASGYDMLPDWETTDVSPPQSQVKKLPPYSRAMGCPVHWSGADIGPAGIASYDVQYRVGTTGAWTDWQTGAAATSALFSGPPRAVVYFRSRARDNAGNLEPWPAAEDGDASTTLYTWQLSGQVMDNRGMPLVHVPVTITPAPLSSVRTDLYGRYLARLTAEGAHILEASHRGYAAISPSQLDVVSDRSLDLYLPPQANIIQNGGFEADDQQLTDWVVGGTLPVAVTTAVHHTGLKAASLGLPRPVPCLSDPEPIWSGFYYLSPLALAIDSTGNVHVIWLGVNHALGQPVYYGFRTSEGIWTGPFELGDTGDYHSAVRLGLAVDGHDILHAIWNGSAGLYYSQRLAQGNWTPPVVLGPGNDPAIAADSQGGVHVIYHCYSAGCAGGGRIYYLEKLPAGTWKAPIPLDTGQGYFGPDLTVGPDDTVHFVWYERGAYDMGIFYRARLPDGTWTAREKLFGGFSAQRRVVADASGRLHLFWASTSDETGYYANRTPGGAWSTPVALPKAFGPADLAVDRQGGVHIVVIHSSIAEQETRGTYYHYKVPGGEWSDPVKLSDELSSRSIAFDPYDLMHMVWTGPVSLLYQTTCRSAQAGISSIGQTITIPVEAHRPTLSFVYELRGAIPGGRSGLEVSVSNHITTTQVFSTTTSTPWSLAWIDLQPWAGQTVTVTFSLRQAEGDPYVRLFLDDVSLGSWLTPVITDVSPSRIEAWTSTPITITGENFIVTPTLRINETPLDDVVWVDEHTLQATLPADLPPGVYDVWVTNPGGQDGVLPGGLRIGRQLYLPTLFKEFEP